MNKTKNMVINYLFVKILRIIGSQMKLRLSNAGNTHFLKNYEKNMTEICKKYFENECNSPRIKAQNPTVRYILAVV